ncbi:MAG: glycosylase [Anaerolineae bacterium]|nr:glycosylase [Anaerolineae bacterium]
MFRSFTPITEELESEFRNPAWLEKAIIYEIYPQSFYDTNGDGIGDLPGVIAKLDYIQSLGANVIWLNPCFTSPFGDAGYDVADFYQVAPRYGTNEDLRRLFEAAHQRGMRVLLDLVAGHTSVECEWFKQSARHERNEYADWYIWNPNPYAAMFGGSSRHQFIAGMTERFGGYMPNFYPLQPALNYGFANPDPDQPWQQAVDAPGPKAVRAELRKIIHFWLEMGADGFRVDMAASLVKDDPGSRATIALWQEIRTWLDAEHPEAVLISEWGRPDRAIKAGFHVDLYLDFAGAGMRALFRKHHSMMGFGGGGFSFFDREGLGNIMEFVTEYQQRFNATRKAGYLCLFSGNHDITPRLGKGRDFEDLKLAYAFLMTMPGVPKVYYGDEVGMVGVAGLPSKEGGYMRTEVRTPMQWSHAKNAGFSDAPADQLYLPVEADLDHRTVADQESDPDSLLNTIRALTRLRLAHPALLNHTDFQVVYARAGRYPFAYLRQGGGESVLVALNPSASAAAVDLPADALPEGIHSAECLWGAPDSLHRTESGWKLTLPGVSGGIYRVQ